MEAWAPVKGFEGRYSVSTLGNVVSHAWKGHPGVSKPLRGARLGGYVRFNLAGTWAFGHTLVLDAFVGSAPQGMEGCHGNNVRSDNRLENLRWDTQSGNQKDRIVHGTHNRGEKSGKAKLLNTQVQEIRERKAAGDRGVDLAKEFGVSTRTIHQIVSGQRRKFG